MDVHSNSRIVVVGDNDSTVDVHSNSRIVVVGDNDSDIAGLLYVKRGVRLSGGKTSVNCISMSQY